jgi:hypothetical protein
MCLETSLGILTPNRRDFACQFGETRSDGMWSAAGIENVFCPLVMEGDILLSRAGYTCRDGATVCLRLSIY